MDFDLSPDQKDIKAVARELLAARSPWAKVREAAEQQHYDAALWAELVELGWPGIAVAERHGGQGPGAVELAVLPMPPARRSFVVLDGDEAQLVEAPSTKRLTMIDPTRRKR
jgi:alkylation response protein AidB-like acyl-CoA dehydrogenase